MEAVTTVLEALSLTASVAALWFSLSGLFVGRRLRKSNCELKKIIDLQYEENQMILTMMRDLIPKAMDGDFDLDNINDRRKIEKLLQAYDDRSVK